MSMVTGNLIVPLAQCKPVHAFLSHKSKGSALEEVDLSDCDYDFIIFESFDGSIKRLLLKGTSIFQRAGEQFFIKCLQKNYKIN